MTGTDPLIRTCLYCGELFRRRSTFGRPPDYCRPSHRTAAFRERNSAAAPAAPPEHDEAVVRISEVAARQAQRLHRQTRMPSPSPPLEILERCIALMRDVEDLTAVAVRQARERGASWEAIGQVAHVSGDSARTRWSPRQVERLLEQRAKRAGRLHAPYPSVVPARDAAAPSVPGSAEPPDEEGPPGRQLARALADLQAGSAKSLRRLARDTGVSPSFISRLLSGERRPSWPVAEKFVHACGGDPAELRPKWERACGIDDTSPITEAATLSSMTKAISVMQNAFQRLEHVVPAPIGPLADESAQAGALPARQIMSISWAPDGHAALLSGRSEELCATWDRLQQSGIRPETSTGNQE